MKPLMALAALLAFVVAAAAQEAKPPYSWEVSGETAEDFKAKFVAVYKVDQSTPAAVVATYAAYADGRVAARAESDRVNKKWGEVLNRTLEKHEKALLTEGAFKALRDSQAKGREDTYTQTAGEMKTAEETDGADGSKLVVAEQEYKSRRKKRDSDEWDESTTLEKTRFTCVKGEDGTWRIDKVEAWRADYSAMKAGESEPPKVWKEENVMLQYLYAAREDAKNLPPVADAKQDTPEAAAMSLFNSLVVRKSNLEQENINRIQGWTEVIEPLFTQDYLSRLNAKAAETVKERAEAKKKDPAKEVETVADGESGVKIVKLKPRYKWSGSVQIHVRQIEGAWKIEKAGVFEKEYKSGGEPEEVFNVVEDLYGLRHR